MDTKNIVVAAVALAGGIAVGYLAAPSASPSAAPAEPPPARTAHAHASDVDQRENLATLRRRVRELERRLADTAASAVALTNVTARTEPPRGGDWRSRLEEMKKNDPARYAQTTNSMAQWRQRMTDHAQDQLGFFAALDTSVMTPKQRETHERLQNLLERRNELMQMMDISNANVTDAQREEARKEIFGVWGQLQNLANAERDMLLHQTARNLGYTGADAKEVVDTIKAIYDATQLWGMGRHGRGPHGGGPRPH